MIMVRQFSTFALVGGIGTAVHYAILIVMVDRFQLNPVYSSMMGAFIGAISNYFLNYRITFNSDKKHYDAMPKFFAVAGIGFILNAVLMWLAVEQVKLHYLLAQVLVTIVVLVSNFAGNRIWTFRVVR